MLKEDIRLAKKGYMKIAQALYLSVDTVKTYCRSNRIKIKNQENIANCEQCGKSIDKIKRSARLF